MDLSSTPAYSSRNLLHRRGSVSASDPFGIHTQQNFSDERVLRSRLTIVRVTPEEIQDYRDGHRFDSSPGSPEVQRASWSPTSSSSQRTGPSRRLSFASSSFAQEPISPVAPNSPPSYASRKRRSSTSLYAQRTSLTPQQLCDLAQSSVQPHHPVKSEVIETSSLRRSPVHLPDHSSSTANFLPLPDGQFLPFLDRPLEVSDFISTSPTNRLMALLEQAFSAHLRRQRTHTEDSRLPSTSGQTNVPDSHLPVKPTYYNTAPQAWSFQMLLEWMSTVPRSEADDAAWVRAIRACVMAHSEQICVTLLAALGVPMEGGADLDVVSLPVGVPDADLALPELFTTFTGGPLSQLPTLPEIPSNENEDAFQLEISPVTSETIDMVMKPDAQQHSRSGSTSSWSPSSRSSSRLSTTMESIGESDHEQDAGISAESVPFESESHVSDEHLPGEVTVRAGSPTEANTAKFLEQMTKEPLSKMGEQWENEGAQFTGDDRWRNAWEEVENCHGLVISTCERLAADPSLPSSVPHSAMPHAIASPVRPKQRRNTVQVSHVLSGAPGYEGFTWRPGGPLFPMSFTGATGSGDGLSTGLEKGGNLDSYSSSNPVLKPRSRSRSKRPSSVSRSKANTKSPLTPPNSPVAFVYEYE
ncbi:hypothetical protein F5148DRAFT_1008781 [Russula earlei]|uniref:Uncharacterized protein n=1 Tax=Russula earlei TaxID=71964 RepID=A0ACC0UK86_9AGAM|nr:hypothetical protein F5148DRAFT_1008781 [Russula earlei]